MQKIFFFPDQGVGPALDNFHEPSDGLQYHLGTFQCCHSSCPQNGCSSGGDVVDALLLLLFFDKDYQFIVPSLQRVNCSVCCRAAQSSRGANNNILLSKQTPPSLQRINSSHKFALQAQRHNLDQASQIPYSFTFFTRC